jgi:integrase
MRPEGTNPCRRVKRFREIPRERYLSEAELARLGTAMREIETEGRTRSGALAAIRLLILTGARRGEIKNLRWNEVDLEAGLLQLGDSKTGAKVIQLPAAALQILAGIERGGAVWVFPGKSGARPIELDTSWKRVREQAGLEDVRLHDLRHTYASTGVNGGASLPMIGALLGHTRVETTRRYAHLSNDPLRKASEQIGSKLAAALDGRPLAEVVPIERGA